MVGLNVYRTNYKSLYEALQKLLVGVAFFRKDEEFFYIKTRKSKLVDGLVESGSLVILNQETTEQ